MKKTSIQINRENKYTEMSMTISIPFCNKQKGSDFDLDKERLKGEEYCQEVIKAFSKRIIASLERRMKACQDLLVRHLDDIEYSDENGHIVYRRKDGTCGNFNVASFQKMQLIVANFCHLSDAILKDSMALDQILKALLNDTEQDHSDAGKFKYSELISILLESFYYAAYTKGGNL